MGTVVQFECERLLDAALEEVARSDRHEARVVAALHGVSLAGGDWLAELGSEEALLFAANAQLSERLAQRVREACARGGPWPDRVRQGLVALLETLAAQPWSSQVLTRTFPALGPQAHDRYEGLIEGFAALLAGGREHSDMGDELPAQVEHLAAGAAEAIIFEEVQAGRAEGLPDLAPAILYSLLVPFLGPQAAAEEMEKATAVGSDDLEVA